MLAERPGCKRPHIRHVAPAKQVLVTEFVMVSGIKLIECPIGSRLLRIAGAGGELVFGRHIERLARGYPAAGNGGVPGSCPVRGGPGRPILQGGLYAIFRPPRQRTGDTSAERVDLKPVRAGGFVTAGETSRPVLIMSENIKVEQIALPEIRALPVR
jgi:hypothetical protein